MRRARRGISGLMPMQRRSRLGAVQFVRRCKGTRKTPCQNVMTPAEWQRGEFQCFTCRGRIDA